MRVLPHSIVLIHRVTRIAVAFALAATLLGASASRASAIELHVTDVLGKQVSVASKLPTVLIFMSRSAKDASSAFARAVDERLLDRPIESVGIVDVRKYGGLLRSLATKYLKRSAEDAKVKRRERREARGVDASPAAVDRWHLVGDFDGALFAQFGVEAEPKQPLAFVVDCGGALHGPYRDVDPLVAAVASASPAGR